MRISVGQTKPVKGDIAANIEAHKKLIAAAIAYKVDAIFFPELSITGYEPKLAKDLATHQNEEKFSEFQEISNNGQITIGIGIPTISNLGIRISMVIFQPNTVRQLYSKQQLHPDEFPYFINGEEQIVLTVDNKKIVPAICYESLQNSHSANANSLGAEIYVASVAKSQNGVDKAMIHFPALAKQYRMPVLMANCVGYCDNFQTVGKSSVWTKQGILAGQLDDKLEGILIFDTETETVISPTI